MKEFGLIIKLLLCVVAVILFGDYVPESIQQGLFTISVVIKEILVFCIPFVVFVFVASCLLAFQRSAPVLIALLLAMITVSNYAFTLFGYGAAVLCLPDLSSISAGPYQNIGVDLVPYFTLNLPTVLKTDMALIAGVIVGLFGAFFGTDGMRDFSHRMKDRVQWALSNLFIPVLPLYILGFLIKVQHDNSLAEMFQSYAPMLVLIVGAQLAATLIAYAVACGGNPRAMFEALKVAFSSGVVGFSTMSSAATMPVTLEAAKTNTQNPDLVQVVVPASANIHLVADSVAIPILIISVYAVSGMPPMTFEGFLYFSIFYMISKFGVAAVPGGGLIVLLPLLESQFGFTSQMSGLITTLYILLDPFITTFNVLSNGAFAIFMSKVCRALNVGSNTPEPQSVNVS